MAEGSVIVVGAGPTGLVLAIELARRGIPIHLIDRDAVPHGWLKTVSVHGRPLEIFDALGLRHQFSERGLALAAVDIFADGALIGSLAQDDIDTTTPFIMSIPQNEAEAILSARLEELGGRVERGVEFVGLEQDEQGVRVRLRSRDGSERSLEAGWVVGTDGLHSAVREAVADAYEGHDYPLPWCVFDSHIAEMQRPADRAFKLCEPSALNPVPLRDGRWRIYLRLETTDDDGIAIARERLKTVAPSARLLDPDEPQIYHTHCKIAHSFRIGRVLLAGDAAHVLTPIHGRGMSVGIQDAFNLGWKLALVAQGVAPLSLLDSYEAERRPVVLANAKAGDDAESQFLTPNPAALETMAAQLADPEVRRRLVLAAAEFDVGYDRSPIVAELPSGSGAAATKVGYLVADVAGLAGPDGPLRLRDLMRGTGHVLLLLLAEAGADVLAAGIALVRSALERYGPYLDGYVVMRKAAGGQAVEKELLLDLEGALHAGLGGDGVLCVLRPDGVLGLRAAPAALDSLDAYFNRLLWRA